MFVWDDDKNRLNIKKHGIDFETASFVFDDSDRLEYYDSKHSIFEDRYITIGSINGMITVLYVVFTERKGDIRIISARKANDAERKVYYDKKRN